MVRVSDTSHLTRPTEIQNSLALAKPAEDRTVPYRKSEISQQQNGGGVGSTQIGHAPVRVEAQGQTAVQCRQNEISQQQKNSSRAVLTQIGHVPGRLEVQDPTAVQCRKNENLQQQNCSGGVSTQIGYAPVRLEAQGQKQQFSAGRAILCSSKTVSGAVSNQIGHAPVRLEVATTESREVRVSDTSHLTRPTEIQNSLGLAKPAADRAVLCRKSEISQQQNGGGVGLTQIGHAPVRLEAQGQTAVQCRQNAISQQQKNSRRAVLTQIGHVPGRLEARGQAAVHQCRQNKNLHQQNCSGAVSTQIGYAPVRLEAQGQTAVQCRQSDSSQ